MSNKKYSDEFKLKIVREYLNSNSNLKYLSKKYNIDYSQFREWVNLYKNNGLNGIIEVNKIYDGKFKIKVVEHMLTNKLSVRKTASIFGIHSHCTVSKWKEKYIKEGKESLLKNSRKREIKIVKNNRDKKEKKSNEEYSSLDYKQLQKKIKSLQKKMEYLEAENAYLKKLKCPSSPAEKITEREKVIVILELRQTYPLRLLLKCSKVSKSNFYYHLKKLQEEDKDSVIKEEILSIFEVNNGCYGYRRITLELKNRGYKINHKKVRRLMKLMELKCTIRAKKYSSYQGTVGTVASNIINRNFVAEAPNQKWTTDVTQFLVGGIKLYLSAILDMYNGEIIAYDISEHPNLEQVMRMLDKAFEKIDDNTNLILHSDQGSLYQHEKYQKKLEEKGIIQSMSRKGNCLDNSPIENFFGILKSEFFYGYKFDDVNEFKVKLENYIYYYNNDRIKEKLNGQSPVKYRIMFNQ